MTWFIVGVIVGALGEASIVVTLLAMRGADAHRIFHIITPWLKERSEVRRGSHTPHNIPASSRFSGRMSGRGIPRPR